MKSIISRIEKHPQYKLKRIIFWSCFLFFFIMNTHARYSCTGDELHYLLISHSLLYDRDFELSNNIINKDCLFFHTSEELASHSIKSKNGKFYSKHGVGLPVLVLPAYALGKGLSSLFSEPFLNKFNLTKSMLCYKVVSLFIIFLTCLLIINLYLLCYQYTQSKYYSLYIAFLTAFCSPILFYSNQIFTEIPTALIMIYILRRYSKKSQFQNLYSLLLVSAGIAFLPWLHFKYVLFSFIISLFLMKKFMRLRTKKIIMISFFLPTLFSLILLGVYQLIGVPIVHSHAGFRLSVNAINGLLGLLFDQEFGLLIYSPIFIFAILGLSKLYRNRKDIFYFIIINSLGIYFVSGFYEHWHGGWCPPSRYLIPVIPLISILLFSVIQNYKSNIFKWVFRLILCYNLLSSLILWYKPMLLWNYGDGSSRLFEYYSNFFKLNLSKCFPSFIKPDISSYLLLLFWVGLAGLLIGRIKCTKIDLTPHIDKGNGLAGGKGQRIKDA